MTQTKKTKIVATIGPATESEEMLTKLFEAGLDVMRFNFSHGTHEDHQKKLEAGRAAASKIGKTFASLQDLSGPKIRIGDFYQERVNLTPGEMFTLTTEDVVGDEHKAHINYPTLPQELKVGGFVLLDDGKKKLQVVEIEGNEVRCKIIVGGDTKGRRGVNLPGAYLKTSSITEKDRGDLAWGIKNAVDYVALSFVREPKDIEELRGMLKDANSSAQIIAKIETQEAIDNLEAVIDAADGVMVARGDLAIEVPAEQVPMIQKRIIRRCNELGKPVITATQMLESMIKSPVPTRAEVSDIANAIMDGTDGVMLSEETTLGLFPVEAISVMTRIALEVEKADLPRYDVESGKHGIMDYVDSLTAMVVNTAHDISAKAIFALTETGFTARMISRFKPDMHILSLSPNKETLQRLALSWGCVPIGVERVTTLEGLEETVKTYCLKEGIGSKGDRVVVSAGAPFNHNQKSNLLLVIEL